VLRAINLAVTRTPRKVIQLVAARRVTPAGSVRAPSSRNQVRAVVRQRLYGARRGRRPTINGLRKLRLLAVEASATTLMHLVARGATLRRTTTKALRARLHRQNKRAATGFSRPVRGPKPRRRFWRQGRRGYAGLFGKRRYRVGRRDRVLVRRASRRLTLRRALAARVLSARATRRNFAVRVQRYSAVASQRFLSNTSSSAAHARFLTARAQGYAYTFGRMSITQRRYRATRRTSRSPRTVNSILSKPAVRTMSASARGVRQQLLQYVANPKILQDYQQLIACRQ